VPVGFAVPFLAFLYICEMRIRVDFQPSSAWTVQTNLRPKYFAAAHQKKGPILSEMKKKKTTAQATSQAVLGGVAGPLQF